MDDMVLFGYNIVIQFRRKMKYNTKTLPITNILPASKYTGLNERYVVDCTKI